MSFLVDFNRLIFDFLVFSDRFSKEISLEIFFIMRLDRYPYSEDIFGVSFDFIEGKLLTGTAD